MNGAAQSYRSHRRIVPGFHVLTGGLIGFSLVWSIVRVVKHPGTGALGFLLQSVIALLLFWYSRAFAVGVQDRVICLEERLRLARLLPQDLQSRSRELAPEQLIALRFASDAELPALVLQVLTEDLRDRDAIKKRITNWRADMQRV